MAASPPPADAATTPAKKGPSLLVQGAMLLVTTLIAAGMGVLGGGMVQPGAPAEKSAAAPGPMPDAHGKKPKKDDHGGGGHGEEEAEPLPGQPAVIALHPITTNLAAPVGTWVRLELALEAEQALEPGMADTVQEDFLAYLRTVKLHQIDGPSGLIHLKADLEERARIRSQDKIAHVFVRSMIFE